MKGIVLLRHGEGLWNKENRSTGWTDADLSEKGAEETYKASDTLRKAGFSFEAAYTFYLKRTVKTLNCVLDRLGKDWILVEKTWRLNEKHYGMLRGLSKSETAVQYGEEQAHIWRRGYDVAPTPVGKDDSRNPDMSIRCIGVSDGELPHTKSPKDTIGRVIPYWKYIIFPVLMHKDSLLVVAYSSSLRRTIKHLEGVSDTDIFNLNLPTAVPYVFKFDDRLVFAKDYYLGNPEEVWERAETVAEQGTAKK